MPTTSSKSITDLPPEIINLIAQHLDPKDIVALRAVAIVFWNNTATLATLINKIQTQTRKKVAAGTYHSLAWTADGRVFACWGDNDNYQLGLGHNTNKNTLQMLQLNLAPGLDKLIYRYNLLRVSK